MEFGSDLNLTEVIQPTKLTDINDDCKILIFEYLDWLDLINVAETTKQLHSAAHDVFQRKYGCEEIIIRYSVIHAYNIIIKSIISLKIVFTRFFFKFFLVRVQTSTNHWRTVS